MLHGTSHWKAIIHRYSLKESQNPYLLHVVMGACPKPKKAVLDAFRPLEVKFVITIVQMVNYELPCLHSLPCRGYVVASLL